MVDQCLFRTLTWPEILPFSHGNHPLTSMAMECLALCHRCLDILARVGRRICRRWTRWAFDILILMRNLFSVDWTRYFVSFVASNNKYLSYCRETTRSLILFQLTSSVICKIMHKIGFLGHPMGLSGAIYALYLKFLTKKPCSRVSSKNVRFTRITAN